MWLIIISNLNSKMAEKTYYENQGDKLQEYAETPSKYSGGSVYTREVLD